MFDEQNQNPGAPTNLPVEPTDMFAGMDRQGGNSSMTQTPDALAAGLLKKKSDSANPQFPSDENPGMMFQNDSKLSGPAAGKIIILLVVFLLLGGLAYGGWKFFGSSKNKKTNLPAVSTTDQTAQNQISQTPVNTVTTTVVVTSSANIPAQINNDQILFGQAVDRDKDGLDDVREKELGTDPLKADTDGDSLKDGDEVITYKTNPLLADTDGDGLSDGDEVLIWHSNPLNKDTDGDKYLDGEEVKNGYSPIGPGKLFNSASTTPHSTTSTSST